MGRLLNEYMTEMNRVVFEHHGTVDKFIGDGIMIIFGAPVKVAPHMQVKHATECARAMQRAMIALCEKWKSEGVPELRLRIGIHHGAVVVGNFGDERRSDYTAIGPTVNLASRIESACTPGDVFLSGEAVDYLPEGSAVEAGVFEFKGIEAKVALFRLA